MLNIYQLPDATESVKSIGLSNTLILIILFAVLTGVAFLGRWFLRTLEKKDTEIIRQMDVRQADISKTEQALRLVSDALKDNAQGLGSVKTSLDELVREQRTKRSRD